MMSRCAFGCGEIDGRSVCKGCATCCGLENSVNIYPPSRKASIQLTFTERARSLRCLSALAREPCIESGEVLGKMLVLMSNLRQHLAQGRTHFDLGTAIQIVSTTEMIRSQ